MRRADYVNITAMLAYVMAIVPTFVDFCAACCCMVRII